MKTFLVATTCLLAVATTQAQTRSIRTFNNKYKGKSEIQHISVGGFSLRLAGFILKVDGDDKDAQTLGQTLNRVKRAKIYTIADGSQVDPNDIADLKNSLTRNDHFDVLMEVRDKQSIIEVLNKSENEDELGNVVMLIRDEKDFVIVNVETTLKISDVNKLINQFAYNK